MRFKESYLFYKFKYSPIGRKLLTWRYRKLKRILRREANLYREILKDAPPGSLIFDIGANLGYISEIFVEFGHSVIAIEPAPSNIRCLKARFGNDQKVNIVEAAVGAESGVAQLHLQDIGSTLHTLNSKWKDHLSQSVKDKMGRQFRFSRSIEVPVTTIQNLVEEFGQPYFIKIDTEGFEQEVLSGLSNTVPYLSFEVNLPIFLQESIHCVNLLTSKNPNYRYSYATKDNCLPKKFVAAEDMIHFLKNTGLQHLDIFCKTISIAF